MNNFKVICSLLLLFAPMVKSKEIMMGWKNTQGAVTDINGL